MQLHQLKPTHRQFKRKRIGRGGKKGGSSGFGVGKRGSSQPRTREVIKQYPKLRGYRFQEADPAYVIINLDMLEKSFVEGDVVSPAALLEKKLIRTIQRKTPKVKILGQGVVTKALKIEGCMVSKSVKEKIQKAGGIV